MIRETDITQSHQANVSPAYNDGLPTVPGNGVDADLFNLLEALKYAQKMQREKGVDLRELIAYYVKAIGKLKRMR